MARIFISYSRVDLAFVNQLYHRLQQMRPDAHIWYDQAPHGLLGGDDWWDEIMNAIAACDIFIYILSNESVQSKYCRAEFAEARRLQKRVITIQARDRTSLTGDLANIQFVDMKHGANDADAVARLSGALDRQLSQSRKRRSLWQPRTPKPDDDSLPSRSTDSPDVDTPSLDVPAVNNGPRWRKPVAILGAILVLAVAVVVAVPAKPPLVEEPMPASASFLEQTAFTPITRNADWEPVEQSFDGVAMVLVPAGCFMMGSIQSEEEEPVHEQCFEAPFWMDKYEVTQAQFVRFSGIATQPSYFDGADRPAEQVTWFEARGFCALRGARLPTEREREYAARGPDGLVYPWGNEWNANNVVWSGNSNSQTATVGSLPEGASWVGALDMSGNVWEWVSTSLGLDDGDYDFSDSGERSYDYPYSNTDGREQDSDGTTSIRALRGGSFDVADRMALRAAFRSGLTPDDAFNDDGLRCARSY